jgi:hypothetical protein
MVGIKMPAQLSSYLTMWGLKTFTKFLKILYMSRILRNSYDISRNFATFCMSCEFYEVAMKFHEISRNFITSLEGGSKEANSGEFSIEPWLGFMCLKAPTQPWLPLMFSFKPACNILLVRVKIPTQVNFTPGSGNVMLADIEHEALTLF